MKAMILAAGLGTRLRPLTDDRPKALVEIAGRTLLEITLSRLRAFGINDVIVNVHHFADMIAAYLKSNQNFGMHIEISREDGLLLDTGGGLKKAAWFFLGDPARSNEPFILHNVDVISAIDLFRMVQFHNDHAALATLAVQKRNSSRQLLFNAQLQLCGRRIAGKDALVPIPRPTVIPSEARFLRSGCIYGARNLLSGETPNPTQAQQPGRPNLQSLAFSGIHVISPRLLPLITETGAFSIIDSYLRLAAHGESILAFRADHSYWRDLGKPQDLQQASHDVQQKKLWGSEL